MDPQGGRPAERPGCGPAYSPGSRPKGQLGVGIIRDAYYDGLAVDFTQATRSTEAASSCAATSKNGTRSTCRGPRHRSPLRSRSAP